MTGYGVEFRFWQLAVTYLMFSGGPTFAQHVEFDFRTPKTGMQWRAVHDLKPLKIVSSGLLIDPSGDDPYMEGPVRSFPAGIPLIAELKATSDNGGSCQIFYYPPISGPSEKQSVRFLLPPGVDQTVFVPLPPLDEKIRFRFDPPSTGTTTLHSIRIEPRVKVELPPLPSVDSLPVLDNQQMLTAGQLVLRISGKKWNSFVLEYRNSAITAGFPHPQMGVQSGNEVRWIDINRFGRVELRPVDQGYESRCELVDGEGARWSLSQTFIAEPGSSNRLSFKSELKCDRDQLLISVPHLLLCTGLGTFNRDKTQALMAGVEYLDHDPSSSEADLVGPMALRRVPDATKLTFPLMAVHHRDRWCALIWDRAPELSALFDSPDRTYNTQSHLMGLLSPGTNGNLRIDGEVNPFRPVPLKAGLPLSATATLVAGDGPSLIGAVQAYVALKGLPALPECGNVEQFVADAAYGWLDTSIRQGGQFRHALPSEKFAAQPAADAAWMMSQLAGLTTASPLAARLTEASQQAWTSVKGHDLIAARVGHIALPVGPLLTGDIAEQVSRSRQRAQQLLGRFDEQNRVLYVPRPDVDYSRTHWSKEANGLAGQVVADLLSEAAFVGDRPLIDAAITKLEALDRFAHTVPRGAQTWEIPLHTPDILASAHLVRAYVLGYELTGRQEFLDSARQWAWTGVPFVYLVNPFNKPIGSYATIAVLGATNWEAPIWIGLPVQWCGLCYAHSLLRLAKHDPERPWKQLASGIGRSGIQQCYQAEHPHRGLLPDSFTLELQQRNIFDINPGTLHPIAISALTERSPYDFATAARGKLLLHVPGDVQTRFDSTAGTASFSVDPWSPDPVLLLLHGLEDINALELIQSGVVKPLTAERLPDSQSLKIRVQGKSEIRCRIGTAHP